MFLIVLGVAVYCRPAAHRHEPDQTAQILVDSMTTKYFHIKYSRMNRCGNTMTTLLYLLVVTQIILVLIIIILYTFGG